MVDSRTVLARIRRDLAADQSEPDSGRKHSRCMEAFKALDLAFSALSCAIFLDEVGHQAIGLGIHHSRCVEEYLAWMYSLQQMKAWGIEISPRVQQRVQRSLRYAVRKAVRRGIRELPPELEAYR